LFAATLFFSDMLTPDASEESKQGGVDKPGGSNIGLIVGLVIGAVFIIALIVGGVLFQRWRVAQPEKKEESPWDPTTEFFHHTAREKMEEISVDFNNPIYNGAGQTILDDDLDAALSDDSENLL
jgi:hypothetical protein